MPLGPDPFGGIVIPGMAGAGQTVERRLDLVPPTLIVERSPDQLGDEGAAPPATGSGIQLGDEVRLELNVHTHVSKSTHTLRDGVGCGRVHWDRSALTSAAGHESGVHRMSDLADTGAIDWLLLEAPGKKINGELIPPLLDLVDRRLIRILDVLILVKRDDDDFDALTTSELDPGQVGEFGALAGASSGLLSDEDAAAAASALAPDSLGLLIVYENLWSLPFSVAARKVGGQLVAHGHIPTQAIVAALTPSRLDGRSFLMGLIGGMARTAVVAGTATAVATASRAARPTVGPRRTSRRMPNRNTRTAVRPAAIRRRTRRA